MMPGLVPGIGVFDVFVMVVGWVERGRGAEAGSEAVIPREPTG
jgi:hypothetical protein